MSGARNLMGALMAIAGLFLTACQTAQQGAQPAVLISQDEMSMAALKATLSEAMGRASIELGAGDLTEVSTVAVLPPPLGPHEMNSPAMPELFDLMMQDGNCLLIHRKTGNTHPLDGVACRTVSE